MITLNLKKVLPLFLFLLLSSIAHADTCPAKVEAFWDKSVVFSGSNVTFTIRFYDANNFLIPGLSSYNVSEAYLNNIKQDHIPRLYDSNIVFSGGHSPYLSGVYSRTDTIGAPSTGYGVYKYVYVTNAPGCTPVDTTAQIELRSSISGLSNYKQFSPNSLVVYGTRSPTASYMPCLEEFRVAWPDSTIVSDTEVTWELPRNVILLGTPETNWYVAKLAEAGKSPDYAYWKNELKDRYFVQIVKDAFVKGDDALVIAGYDDKQSKIACDYFLTNQQPMSYGATPKTVGCIRSRPSISISPHSSVAEVGKDTKVIYAVEVFNKDNGECGASIFNHWTKNDPTLTIYDGIGKELPSIKPGESFKYAMQVSASSKTRLAEYYIIVGVVNNNSEIYASTASAILSVVINPQNETKSSEKNVGAEIPKTEQNTINQSIKCDNGCLYEGACVSYGLRVQKGNVFEYCDLTGRITEQKQEGVQCQNNYECSSNFCSEGKCASIPKEVGQTKGLLQSIVFFFKSLFGF